MSILAQSLKKHGSDAPRYLTVPLWKLAGNLTYLALDLDACECSGFQRIVESRTENAEEEEPLASFELPSELPTAYEARVLLHFSIAYRTIIAAARGGKLKRLVADKNVERPFAIPALLPYWVDAKVTPSHYSQVSTWQEAALAWRARLYHASLWIGATSSTSPRYDRRLTYHNIQTLRPHLPVPTGRSRDELEPQLLWVEKDAELAGKVADAWNGVVQRGEADVVQCWCLKCKKYRLREQSEKGEQREA